MSRSVLIDAVNVFLARRSSQKGFTLVELLVVISIIGVLATLVLLQLGTARAKSRDAKRIADVNQIRSAVEQYFEDNGGKYPTAINAAALSKYMTIIPTDPLDSTKLYKYAHSPATNPIRYHIWTELEGKGNAHGSDADINSAAWAGTTGDSLDASVAGAEACANSAITDSECVYDQGAN